MRMRDWSSDVCSSDLTAEEIIGQHFSVFYPQEQRDRGWPGRELELALRDGRMEDEGWRLRKDGSRFWANVVITALYDGNGRHRGFAKVTRDLTRHRRIDTLEHEARTLQRVTEAVGRASLRERGCQIGEKSE